MSGCITCIRKLLGKFRQYDYGILGNMNKYGQLFPPDYDLGKITSPVALYYGSNDFFASTIVNIYICHLAQRK